MLRIGIVSVIIMLVLNRRQLLKGAAFSTALAGPRASAQTASLKIAGRDAELHISPVSAHTLRISLLEVVNVSYVPPAFDDSLVQQSWGDPIAKIRNLKRAQTVRVGYLRTVIELNPISIADQTTYGRSVHRLRR